MLTLKISTLEKDKYYDMDYIILHACFQILCDFVEQENPQGDEFKEVLELYEWWKEDRNKLVEEVDRLFKVEVREGVQMGSLWDEVDDELIRIDQMQLERLARVRSDLWT